MAKNITCPQCGAQMQRESYPNRYVCPYCDTIIYPEEREESSYSPEPSTQQIHTSESAITKEEENKEPWHIDADVENEPNNEDDNGEGLVIAIGIVIIVTIIGVLASGI